VLTTLKVPDDVPIENKRVTNSIASAQGQVESQNFDSRKNVLKYDDVMSRQREVVYGERRAVLEGADLHDQVLEMIEQVAQSYVVGATAGFPEEWNLEALWTALKTLYPISLKLKEIEDEAGGPDGLERSTLVDLVRADALAAYAAREEQFGSEVMRELERRVLLSVLDRKWREHLYEMDYLREGIGLRAYSQRDPLVEYQREGFDMFGAMMDGIKEESVAFLFNLEVQIEEAGEEDEADEDDALEIVEHVHEHEHEPVILAKGLEAPKAPTALTYSAPSETGDTQVSGALPVQVDDEFAAAGRNDLCPCGSGKKYKRCHGSPHGPTGQTARVS
jgi:preprotein translocase subunit SecA